MRWWSDHLSFTSSEGVNSRKLQPIWFTEECRDTLVRNIKMVKDGASCPFLVENSAYYVRMPFVEMDEARFVTEVLEASDVGMLLDVSNLHVNAVNFKYDPMEFLSHIPLERVVQVHLGGSRTVGGVLVDSHADPVTHEAWNLLEEVLRRSPVRAVSLERDGQMPPFPVLMQELDYAREICSRVHRH